MRGLKRLLRGATIAGITTGLAASLAAGTATAQDDGLGGETIVVTAQKREQRALDVPISLTALSGDFIDRKGITDIRDIFRFVPSVTFDEQLISGGARIRIRGIGGPTFTSGVETSVSVVQDGIVAGPAGSGLADLFDLERIEVLRGPQGTLFGKNSTGGVINVVSAAPTDEFEAYATVRFTQGDFDPIGNDYRRYRVEGAVSGPIAGNLRGRIAAFFLDDAEGFIDDVILNDTQNRKERWGLRTRFDYELDQFRSDLVLQYVRTNDRCCAPTFVDIAPEAVGLGLNPALIDALEAVGAEIADDNRIAINSDRIGEEQEVFQASWTNSWEFNNGHELRSITGYRNFISHGEDDSDKAFLLVDATEANQNLRIITQELQFLSPGDGPFNYVVGLYSFFQRLSDQFIVGIPGTPSNARNLVKITNLALFGDATYAFAPQWEAFAGARLIYEDQEITGRRTGAFFGGQPDNNIDFRRETVDDVDWSGRAGIRFIPTENNSLFVAYNRGYKGHGLNNANSGPFFDNTSPVDPILDPETVNAVEIGSKNVFWEGRANVNIVFFWNRYKDFQTSAFEGATNTFSLRNAGVITIKGIEFDGNVNPWEGANFFATAAYVDGEFTEFEGAPCTALQVATGTCPAQGQDLSGEDIDGTPKFQFTIGGQQDFMLPDDMMVYIGGEYLYQGERQYNSDLDPLLVDDAYGVANFRAGFVPNENFEIVAFLENAFDTVYLTNKRPAPVFAGVAGGFVAPGRTYGVELRFTY